MRRLLVAAALGAGLVLSVAPTANACQPEYCPPPPPWCQVQALQRFCIRPY